MHTVAEDVIIFFVLFCSRLHLRHMASDGDK